MSKKTSNFKQEKQNILDQSSHNRLNNNLIRCQFRNLNSISVKLALKESSIITSQNKSKNKIIKFKLEKIINNPKIHQINNKIQLIHKINKSKIRRTHKINKTSLKKLNNKIFFLDLQR